MRGGKAQNQVGYIYVRQPVLVVKVYAAYLLNPFQSSQILMARFLIFGTVDFLILGVIIGIVSTQSEFYLLRTVLYLITPCTMTAALSLWIIRRTPRNESIYFCAAASAFISIAHDLAGSSGAYFYHPDLLPVWEFLCLASVCFLLKQGKELLSSARKGQLLFIH